MLDTELLQSIATQLARGTEVVVAGKTLRAARTSTRLKSLRFEMNGRDYQAIEQNPRKPSRWGQLARDGHQVVQFRDVQSNKYVRSEEHTSELQSRGHLVCRLLLEKKHQKQHQ